MSKERFVTTAVLALDVSPSLKRTVFAIGCWVEVRALKVVRGTKISGTCMRVLPGLNASRAYIYQRCHPLWATITPFFRRPDAEHGRSRAATRSEQSAGTPPQGV
jgi:hypothetical protein